MQELNSHKTETGVEINLRVDDPVGLCQAELTKMAGEPSAFLEGMEGWVLDKTRPVYFFNRLIVTEGHRRKGIGTKLVKSVIRFANRERAYVVNQASSYNKSVFPQSDLEDFYLKHGFMRVAENFLIYAPEGVMTIPAFSTLIKPLAEA